MPADLSTYLASRYLVADKKKSSKKRKRKGNASDGLVITEDDADLWPQPDTTENDDRSDFAATIHSTSVSRHGDRKANWKRVGPKDKDDTEGKAAADAILASTAMENDMRQEASRDLPVVENLEGLAKMSDGTHAGLQTAAAVSAQLRQRRLEEEEDFTRYKKSAKEEETVYRDATGRRIDIAMKRAHARKAIAEAEEREKQAKEALKGKVQEQERKRQDELLEEAKLIPFARAIDDESLNRELRKQERWNDPMLHFMTDAKADSRKKFSSKRQPQYAGVAPSNRYGIKPGYRWDGVDRSIGYEDQRARAMTRHEKILDHSWEIDE